jgi:spore germination protein GerM
MTVDEVFATFVQEEGQDMLKDHVIQVWWYAQTEAEDYLLQVIENLSQQYPDPEAAEVGFIALWQHIARG